MRSSPRFDSRAPQRRCSVCVLGASLQSVAASRFTMSGLCRASVFCVVALIFYGSVVTTEAQTATPAPAPTPCASRSNTSCAECLQNVTCLWCSSSRRCVDYPVRNILPPSSVCPLYDARWGLCWVNFQVLIIAMSVVAGVIIIALLVCCFCCCKCKRTGNKREDVQLERQNRARKSRQKAKRTEMQLRHDEIRQKYGMAKDNPYARMDNH